MYVFCFVIIFAIDSTIILKSILFSFFRFIQIWHRSFTDQTHREVIYGTVRYELACIEAPPIAKVVARGMRHIVNLFMMCTAMCKFTCSWR